MTKKEVEKVLANYLKAVREFRHCAHLLAGKISSIVKLDRKELSLGADLYVTQELGGHQVIWIKTRMGKERVGPHLPTTSLRVHKEFVAKVSLIDKQDSTCVSPLRQKSLIKEFVDRAKKARYELDAETAFLMGMAHEVAKHIVASGKELPEGSGFIGSTNDELIYDDGLTGLSKVKDINNPDVLVEFLTTALVLGTV